MGENKRHEIQRNYRQISGQMDYFKERQSGSANKKKTDNSFKLSAFLWGNIYLGVFQGIKTMRDIKYK